MLGVMIDCSRNAVLKPQTVKAFADMIKAMGYDTLMLYTEDTYEVDGHPLFGCMRGKYTKEELRDIDAHCAEIGIELVPCIQTLAHLNGMFAWSEYNDIRDCDDILLAEDEKTYQLIESMIASVSQSFSSKKIHIGMDEAYRVGTGKYKRIHGEGDRFEIINRHLHRVCEIVEKYGFEPIMWSDMYFRLASEKNDYYDRDVVIPQRVIDSIAPVSLCYWDYYHEDEALYDHMITEHERTGRPVAFAGGCWTWAGFLPHVKITEATMLPALRVAARHHVQTVLATMWGDDGAETNYFLGMPMLPLFSEACWQGDTVTMDDALALGEGITGLSPQAVRAMGDFFPDSADAREGKGLVWSDPLYPLIQRTQAQWDEIVARLRAAQNVLSGQDSLECRYAEAVMDVAAGKAMLLRDLRERYLAGDREYLEMVAEEVIPTLLGDFDRLMTLHRELWERDMKRFGWEVLSLRYGAVTGRLKDVQDELSRYLCGELATIEELDAEPMPGERYGLFQRWVTPTVGM